MYDQIHTCAQTVQPIALVATDLFGLVDPAKFSATLSGSFPNGTTSTVDVTSKLATSAAGQTSVYTPGSQSYAVAGNLNTLAEGKYTFKIHSQDLAGNATAPDPYSSTFRVNRTPPMVQLAVSDSIYTNKRTSSYCPTLSNSAWLS